MPELPEVETVRRTLVNLIQGKVIRDVDVFYERMIRNSSIEEWKKSLIDQSIIDIDRYGKYLLFDLGDLILISHLRMEGKYFIKNLDDPRDKHEHVIFYFTDGSTLRYNDTRKFGTFDLVKKEDLWTDSPLVKLGYEPFDSRLTPSYLEKLFSSKTIAIKTALLDQTIITGLGNIYVNEVLFLSKLHPETRTCDVSKYKIKKIIESSKIVLEKAIQLGGTTIRSYTDSLGVTGRFQNELFVHERQGQVCKLCHTEIDKIKVNGRGTYYCPKCQRKLHKKK